MIYEGFYKIYNRKAADRLGVVYTPQEIVRFMVESADWLCQKHFGRALIDKGVEILDPATGTGTYICELLEHFRGQPQKLAYKYKEELHANEVAILPYYVANLNIEATYAAITGQYAEFPNLCFVDTLDNVAALGKFSGHMDDLFGSLSEVNVERIKRQNGRKISVIIGNPPYNAWQENFNQDNANRVYRRIDERIRDTYIRKGTAQNQSSVYDMYTRFFRWASDRLREDGIVAFVSNRNFIEKAAFNGFRRDLADEFNELIFVDLGGDVRANPRLSGTKNNVFGIQTGVGISLLVKKRGAKEFKISYVRMPEMDTAEEKLSWLSNVTLSDLKCDTLRPDGKFDWLNHSTGDWDSFVPLVDDSNRKRAAARMSQSIFQIVSSGLQTKQDDWAFGESKAVVSTKMNFLISAYNVAVAKKSVAAAPLIKWHRELERRRKSGQRLVFREEKIRKSLYRPYCTRDVYYDKETNSQSFRLHEIFIGDKNENITFLGVASSNPLAVLGCAIVFDTCLLKNGNGSTQGVPRYRYTSDGSRLDNITDWALDQFRAHYAGSGPSPLAGPTETLSRFPGGGRRPDEGAQPKPASLKRFAREMRAEPTPAEAALWRLLRNRRFNGFKFRRQTPIGDFIADFVCFEKRLIVEADGSQHEASAGDAARDAWFARQGFRVRRFGNSDILARPKEVMDTLWEDLAGAENPSSGPSGHLLPQGEKGSAQGEKGEITKDAIFHYVYAVLHDPLYREKYAQNLKREFPRIPFYADFSAWAAWGEALMALHIGYEAVAPWPLTRLDVADAKARAAGQKPKPMLKADPATGVITLDSETQLTGVPAAAWAYRLGNRSGLEWILDQHKEKTPKDPTIREKFNTYRFADYKEKVVDLLMRVTRVSVETMQIVEAMRAANR